MNALVVEPDLTFVAALTQAISSEGHFVAGIAITRADAVELLATRSSDVAFVSRDILGRDIEPHLLWSMERHGVAAVLTVRDHLDAAGYAGLLFGSLARPITPAALRQSVQAIAARLAGVTAQIRPPELVFYNHKQERQKV